MKSELQADSFSTNILKHVLGKSLHAIAIGLARNELSLVRVVINSVGTVPCATRLVCLHHVGGREGHSVTRKLEREEASHVQDTKGPGRKGGGARCKISEWLTQSAVGY